MKNEIDKIKLNFLKKTIHNPLFMDVTVQSQNQVSVSLDSYLYFDHVIWGKIHQHYALIFSSIKWHHETFQGIIVKWDNICPIS